MAGARLCNIARTQSHNGRRTALHCSASSAQPSLIYGVSAAPRHDNPGHPECAARIPAITDALALHKVAAAMRSDIVQLQTSRVATVEQILAIHSPAIMRGVEVMSDRPDGDVGTIEQGTTFFTNTSYNDALAAIGTVLDLVDAACRPTAAGASPPVAFGICRPPGHHAVVSQSMGFCLFNTAAVAARYAQQAHGMQRVMIIDFDVHAGNGTSDIFEHDPSVLFVSTHQQGIYPFQGKLTDVGKGDGEGLTMHIPLPGDSGETAILMAFDEAVGPAAARFQPDLIIVSAGYDAHWRDPLAQLQFRSSTYHKLAGRVRDWAVQLCGGRVVFVLEGGYDLKALGESVANTFLGVLGEEAVDKFDAALLREEPLDKVGEVLREARRIHAL